MIDIQVPDLGENVEEAEVLKVLVEEGETVEVDQAILEFETEKATFEMPSSEAGTVAKVHVKEGDTVKIGQVVIQLEAKGKDGGSGQKKPEAKQEKEPEPEKSPEAHDKDKEKKAKKDQKEKKEKQAETQEAKKKETQDAKKEQKEEKEPGADREEEPEESDEASVATAADDDDDDNDSGNGDAPRSSRPDPGRGWAAGPATRRLARELGVDLADLAGAGNGGRITREDLKAWVRQHKDGGGSSALPDFSRWGKIERQAMSRLERTAAERLGRAWREIPHVTQHDEADITALEEARRRYDGARDADDPKITWTVLAVKAVVAALRAMPRFNSSYDPASQELILKKSHHIGIAVDTERGLLVPVVRDADRKTTRQIAADIEQLARRARDRKLMVEDMEGGTFTISNLGGLGGTAFTPIVNLPEVAILGMSRARLVPGTEGGAPRRILPLSLSYDHRVIDGASAVRFLRRVIRMLEDPLHLLLES